MNTLIIVKRETKDELKHMGSKGQTYDQVINELITLKRNSQKPPYNRFLQLSEPQSSQV